MRKLLFLFILGFLFQTSLFAQDSTAQCNLIMGHWVRFEMKNSDSAVVDLIYDGEKVPSILADVKFTKKKAVSTYHHTRQKAKWVIKNGSLFFYFQKIQTERVYKIISISDTELKLLEKRLSYDGVLSEITITYKRK